MADLSQLELQYGLPPGYLAAQMKTESGGNPLAVSSQGALGAFQFMPQTAQQYGIDPLDPDQSANAAAKMDAELLAKYNGDVPSALAAYNWGQGNVDRKGLANAPPETQNYINKIMGQIGNAIVPSANASEIPQDSFANSDLGKLLNLGSGQSANPQDLSHLSDDELKRIADSGNADLSHVSDTDLEKIANGDNKALINKGSNLENAVIGLGQGAQAGLEGLGSIYDLARLPFNALGAEIPSATDIIRAHSPFPAPDNIASDLTRGTTSALASLATGSGLESSAIPIIQKVGSVLTSSPVSQLAAFAGGEAAGGLTKRAGGGEAAQLLATLVGSTPGAIMNDAPAIAKSLTKSASNALVKSSENAVEKIPATSAEAAANANQSYALADKKGGVLTPKFSDDFVNAAEKVAPQTEAGKAIAGDNAITSLVDRMQTLRGKPITLKAAQEIDEHLGNLIDKEYGLKGLSKEGKQIYDLQTSFRNMMGKAGEDQIVGGREGFDAWKQGQQQWSQSMAMRDIEKIMQRAELTDNPATSIRTQMKNLYTNQSRMRAFTSKAEKDAILNASKTGAITGLMKIFGSRLIPISAAAAEGLGGGGITGGLVAGTAAHVLTSGARDVASRLQAARGNKVLEEISKRPSNRRK